MDKKVLVAVSVASMIDQFNMPNIRLLKDMGYEVHVACNFKEGNTCDDRRIRKLQNKLDNLQVERHQWDCPRGILPAWKCVRAYRQLCDLCQKYLFAWIHCQSPIGGALSRMAAHRFKIRVLYTAHGFHFYRGAPFKNWLLYYPAEKWLSKWTDTIITVNKEDYQFAKSKFGVEKIFYIPGIGIETKKFQNVETSKIEHRRFCKKYHIPENARILLSVGELNKGKNHRRVIAALAGIRGTGAAKDVFYVICGQGKQYKALKKYANQLGVGSCVKMPGYQERMPCIYRNADIFLFPSKREGMPTALIEAMAAGLPCIVTDAKGEYIFFLDSDQWIIGDHWMDIALKIIKEHIGIGAVAWNAGWFYPGKLSALIVDYLPNRGMQADMLYRTDIGLLATSGFLMRKRIFKAIGGFDEFYDPTCFEDTYLTLKIRNYGCEVAYTPYMLIRHLPHQTTKSGSAWHSRLMERNEQYCKEKWEKIDAGLFHYYY